MKHVAKVVASALLFGLVAGAAMVGVNVGAQKAGVTNQIVQEATQGSNSNTAETSASDSNKTATVTNSASASDVTASGKTVAEVAKEAMPSVVAITNMMRYQQNGFSLFGSYESQETEVPASGSGVIIGKTDSELLIVTNNHVVTDSNSLSVTFVDNQNVNAEIKGTDASQDLAVVAVKLSDIPESTMNAITIATLGDSDALSVGDQVVAIGNALGYGQSVTTGIISAMNRDVETEEGTESGLLQTDAAINPGNSGGALLNMQGQVIGINVAKYSSTDVEGMGYSIPSSKAQKVIDSLSTLTTREQVPENERGYLGVQVKNIDKETAQSFGMPQGVFIYKFTEGSSAENSGLQEKDIITKLDGQGVTNFDDLQSLLAKYRAGETVTVTVERMDGTGKYVEQDVKVTLGSNPQASSNSSSGSNNGNGQNGQSGQDPFSQPNQNQQGSNGQNGNGGNNNGSSNGNSKDGNQQNNNDELWKQFQQFFNQYQR
jgi:S1-C subfamily serine protease